MSVDEFLLKANIWYGKDSLQRLCDLKFNKVCIVTDQSMVKLGVLKPLLSILNDLKMPFRIFDKVEPDPSLDTVLEGLEHILLNKPDLLIAVGGGSVIDAAKAIIFFCIRVKEEVIKPEKIVKPFFVAVPTTSGTGSEVTSYSVITDKLNDVKLPLKDPRMFPDVAILDPIFTKTLPKKVISHAGIDVLTHAVEAYVSKEHHEISDMFALQAVELVGEYLEKMYQDVSDETCRMNMQLASCYAGIAFENSGLGLNHGMAHALGGKFKLPHGLANALLLPYVIKYNRKDSIQGEVLSKRYGRLYNVLRETRRNHGNGANLEELIVELCKKLEVPRSIREAGIDENEFLASLPEMIDKAMADFCTGSNPRTPTAEDLVRIYLNAYYGEMGHH